MKTLEANNKYYRSKLGVSSRLYNNMKTNSKRRGHNLPSYDLCEFRNWCDKQPFNKLYNDWIASGYDKNKAVSVDRLNDDKGYEFNNIQLMAWEENNRKANEDMRTGKLINKSNPQKPVIQYQEFPSLMEAERCTGIDHRKLSKNCVTKQKINNFTWKFKPTPKADKERIGDAMVKYIEALLEMYNLTCEEGLELTMKDVINFLSRTKKS